MKVMAQAEQVDVLVFGSGTDVPHERRRAPISRERHVHCVPCGGENSP